MTFESDHLRCVFLFNILNSASSLNASNCEARRIWKAADNSRLPFQRALKGLVELSRLVQVDDIDVSICGTHDQKILLHIQGIHSLLALHRGNSLAGSQVPVLDCLVPRASHEHRRIRIWSLEKPNAPDRLIMYRELGSCVLVCGKIDHLRSFVCSCSNNLLAVLVIVSNLSSKSVLRGLTGDQWQLRTGASCSNHAFPSLVPFCAI